MDEILDSVARLTRDIARMKLSPAEARFLVDAYYAMQRDRIRAEHQNRTLMQGAESNLVMNWLEQQRDTLESQLRRALNAYAMGSDVGNWALSITGIGPVFTAGLLANIDIELCPTVGHIWRFAGLDPTNIWYGREKAKDIVIGILADLKYDGPLKAIPDEIIVRIAGAVNTKPELFRNRLVDHRKPEAGLKTSRDDIIAAVAKRPWNGSLKRLCYLMGESFTKVSNNESDVYGKVYKARKQYETAKNEKGEYANQASEALATKNFGVDTEARKHYLQGHLPPARINRRAQRYAVKLFLSDLHCVMHWCRYGTLPPKPYVIDHLGHADYVGVPNRHLVPGLEEALEGVMRKGPYLG